MILGWSTHSRSYVLKVISVLKVSSVLKVWLILHTLFSDAMTGIKYHQFLISLLLKIEVRTGVINVLQDNIDAYERRLGAPHDRNRTGCYQIGNSI